MPKVIRAPESISPPSLSSDKAAKREERDLFVSVALFSAVGLLISLVAILCGMTYAWY
jgi:hypothetical protein